MSTQVSFFCSQETSKEKVKAISFSDLSRETEEGEETFQIKRSFFEECVRLTEKLRKLNSLKLAV